MEACQDLIDRLEKLAREWPKRGAICAEAAEQLRMLELREEGAKTAFEHVVEQKHEIERENKKLRTLLDAAYADIRGFRNGKS